MGGGRYPQHANDNENDLIEHIKLLLERESHAGEMPPALAESPLSVQSNPADVRNDEDAEAGGETEEVGNRDVLEPNACAADADV